MYSNLDCECGSGKKRTFSLSVNVEKRWKTSTFFDVFDVYGCIPTWTVNVDLGTIWEQEDVQFVSKRRKRRKTSTFLDVFDVYACIATWTVNVDLGRRGRSVCL